MNISSRTPEGVPNRCPVCGNAVRLEYSDNGPHPADASCPHCGCLIWLDAGAQAEREAGIATGKARIRSWVKSFAQLSRSAADPVKYHRNMLTGLVSTLAAQGGAIWTPDDAAGPRLQCSVASGAAAIVRHSLFEPWRQRLLEKAFAAGDPSAIQPTGEATSAEEYHNPTQSLILLGPVKRKDQVVALVEIFQRAGAGPNIERGYLMFLRQMCELASGSVAVGDGSFGA